jgi:hypothetical protein
MTFDELPVVPPPHTPLVELARAPKLCLARVRSPKSDVVPEVSKLFVII